MSDILIQTFTRDAYHDLLNRLAEEFPDRSFVIGDVHAPTYDYNEDRRYQRFSDFVYPAELFEEPENLDLLRHAEKRFAAVGLIPDEHLTERDSAVADYDRLHDWVDDAANATEDGTDGEAIFLIGGWSPAGDWQMYGNASNNKPRKVGDMHFPESAFATDGLQALNKMQTWLPGTVVLPTSALTDEAVAFARGEREELPLEERTDDRTPPDEIDATLRSLSTGDRIRVNDRNRALTVVPREETRQFGVHGQDCLFLQGNGTDYRLVLAQNPDERYPELEWQTDSEYVDELDVVERTEEEEAQEVAA